MLVPVYAGVLSALGMLATRPGRQLSQSVIKPLASYKENQLLKDFGVLSEKARQELLIEGHSSEHFTTEFSLDLRYQGQSNSLNIPWTNIVSCEQAFHQLHEKRYGHNLEIDVELVNIRVSVLAQGINFMLANDQNISNHKDASENQTVKSLPRASLDSGQVINGPAIITETVATTWVAEGWQCEVDAVGNLLLSLEA